jgi:hypothetical protein
MPQPKSSGRPKPKADQGKSTESSRSRATSKSTKRPAKTAASRAAAPPAKTTKPKRATKPARSAASRADAKRAKPVAGEPALGASSSADDAFGTALIAIRDRLARGVMFTGERLQETLDDAASRGRLTHKDAEDLAQRLISARRKQTEDLLVELEQIVERGGDELLRASRKVRDKLR